jgi:hypothetical protein
LFTVDVLDDNYVREVLRRQATPQFAAPAKYKPHGEPYILEVKVRDPKELIGVNQWITTYLQVQATTQRKADLANIIVRKDE